MNQNRPLFYQSQLLAKYGVIAGTTYSGLDFSKKSGAESFQALANVLGVDCNRIKLADQAHTNRILEVVDATMDVSGFVVDCLITRVTNLVIGVKTADCIALVVYDPVTKTAATVHLGRVGVISDLLDKTVALLKSKYRVDLHNLIVYFAPSLKPYSHAVFLEVAKEFEPKYYKVLPVGKHRVYNRQQFEDFKNSQGLDDSDLKSRQSALLDLDAVVVDKLIEGGVLRKNIEIHSSDTYSDTDFHSYRREYPSNGQNYSFVML